MKLRKLVSSFFTIALFASCSDVAKPNETPALDKAEAQLTEKEVRVLVRMRKPDNRISVDEALEQANFAINFLNGESTLKSGSNRKVSSVSALVSDNAKPIALKSGGGVRDIEIPDTLAYILNFNDSLGFAIVSADARIDAPILAFSDNGSLTDTIDNPGVAIFLEHLEDYMLNSIVEAEQQKDSLYAGIMEKLDAETSTKATTVIIVGDPVITLTMPPFVPVTWGQGIFYNDSLRDAGCYGDGTANNGKVKAGCVAVATAQIMSKWKHPVDWDWVKLNQYKKGSALPAEVGAQLASLMKRIGSSVGMSYGCSVSNANINSALNLLGAYGFSISPLIDYDAVIAINAIFSGWPLIIDGCAIRNTVLGIPISYDKCHAWVEDGHLLIQYWAYVGNKLGFYQQVYIHNNWGWDGSQNGYYLADTFNSALGPSLNSNTKSGLPGNYQYRVRMSFIVK